MNFANPQPKVPLSYDELLSAIDNGVFPRERYYLDFKEMLYRPNASQRNKADAHAELAADMASMAVHGGYLIYGVKEDKANHTFAPVGMPLPEHLDLAVVSVARTRISPSLDVTPYLLTKAGGDTSGFLVIHIPDSDMAPHQVESVYYSRTETGKRRLEDEEIERLMSRRGRADDRMTAAMMRTKAEGSRLATWEDRVAHLYLTAVPTQPTPDMLAAYTTGHTQRTNFLVWLGNLVNDIGKMRGRRMEAPTPAFAAFGYHFRGGFTDGAWFASWNRGQPGNGRERAVGLDDDGTVRYVNLGAGTNSDGLTRWQVAMNAINPGAPRELDLRIWWEIQDFIYLTSRVAELTGYSGSWLIGLEVTGLAGGASHQLDTETQSLRTGTADLTERPVELAEKLVRRLFRNIGQDRLLEALISEQR